MNTLKRLLNLCWSSLIIFHQIIFKFKYEFKKIKCVASAHCVHKKPDQGSHSVFLPLRRLPPFFMALICVCFISCCSAGFSKGMRLPYAMCSVATGPKNTLPTPAVQHTHMPLNMSVEARARLPTPGKKKNKNTTPHYADDTSSFPR